MLYINLMFDKLLVYLSLLKFIDNQLQSLRYKSTGTTTIISFVFVESEQTINLYSPPLHKKNHDFFPTLSRDQISVAFVACWETKKKGGRELTGFVFL